MCFDSTHAPVATAARAAATGLVSMSTRPDIPSMLHLEREARDWSTYNEYSYRIILLLLLYVYCSRAHPRFPSKFRRRRLQDFFYLYRKLTKILVGRQFSFLCGRQVHFLKRTFANTLLTEKYFIVLPVWYTCTVGSLYRADKVLSVVSSTVAGRLHGRIYIIPTTQFVTDCVGQIDQYMEHW